MSFMAISYDVTIASTRHFSALQQCVQFSDNACAVRTFGGWVAPHHTNLVDHAKGTCFVCLHHCFAA